MAKEIIDAIRQAETEAVKTVAAAEREAEEIVQQAQEKAAEVNKGKSAAECWRMPENRKKKKELGWRLPWRISAGRLWKPSLQS